MKHEPIIREIVIDAPVEKAWQAITDKEQMKQWYFDLAEFRAEPGFEFHFFGGPPEKQYKHLCKVVEVVPNKKISYTWRYDGYPGDSLVTFELFPENGKTRVRLTHSGIETFGDEPDFAKKNFEAGWSEIIGKLLPEFLSK